MGRVPSSQYVGAQPLNLRHGRERGARTCEKTTLVYVGCGFLRVMDWLFAEYLLSFETYRFTNGTEGKVWAPTRRRRTCRASRASRARRRPPGLCVGASECMSACA